MSRTHRGRAIGLAVLAAVSVACTRSRAPVAGQILLDEQVPLTRAGLVDSATRDVSAPPGTVIVATVDEQDTDVSLALAAGAARCEVESARRGEGVEIAVLDSPAAGAVRVTLHGPANSYLPGAVRLRVEAFTAAEAQRAAVANRLEGYRAYAHATRATLTTGDIAADAGPELERAIAAFASRDGGDPRLAAHARLVRAGLFYQFEVDWRVARDGAHAAAAAFAAPDVADALGAARARRIEAQALQEMASSSKEEPEHKQQFLREARRLYAELLGEKSALDAVGRGRVYNDLAAMDYYAQNWDGALAQFQSALALYEAARYRVGETQTRRNISAVAMQRGDYAAAFRTFESLVQDIDLMPDDDSRSSLLNLAGTAALNVGETDVAIDRFLRAKQIAEAGNRPTPRSRALHGLGLAYWARGDVEQARTFFDQAYETRKVIGDDPGMFEVLRSRGLMLRDAGDARNALGAHQAALAHAQGMLQRLRAQAEIALDQAALGDRAHALAAIRAGIAAAKVGQTTADHPVLRDAQLDLAELLILGGKRAAAETAEAAGLAQDALGYAHTTSDLPMEISALRVLASLALERDARDEATRAFEQAIALVIKYSRGSANPELQATTRASQQRLFREYLDMRMAAPGGAAAHQRALEVLETVRALNFLLVRSTSGAHQNAELDGLLAQLASRHVRLAELREHDEPDARVIEQMQLEMATLRAQIDRARASDTGMAHVAIHTDMKPRWTTLARGQVQLSYSLGTTHAYLWRRTAAGIDGWTLPGSAREIRAAVLAAARIDRLQKPAAYDDALVALSGLLLPPDVVPPDAEDVAIVADDELSLIPFAALRSPTDQTRRFAQTHSITMVPTLLDTHPAKPTAARRWRLVAVRGAESAAAAGPALRGSPLFPALPGAGAEVDAVLDRYARDGKGVQVLEGERATVESVRGLMADGAEVMHFATHGLADLRHPLASLLSLPHGLLTAGQIQEWQGNVGLVFLSACETAVGPTRFAEGMPGLQRAFLRAGAGNVVATLWPVEDRLAKEFAEAFYEELSGGLTPAQALARTQRRWLASASGESAQKATRRRVAAWGYVLYAR